MVLLTKPLILFLIIFLPVFTMDVKENLDEDIIEFKPLCKSVIMHELIPEFNKVSRLLYDDCLNPNSVHAQNELNKFKVNYQEYYSKFDSSVNDYIEIISSAQKFIYKYINDLDQIKIKSKNDLILTPLFNNRELFLRCVAHCIYDFSNNDLGYLHQGYWHFVKVFNGTSMVRDVTVTRSGIIITTNETICKEKSSYSNNLYFSILCEKTKDFIDNLYTLPAIVKLLENTKRITKSSLPLQELNLEK